MCPQSAARAGVDPADHLATPLTEDEVAAADLILCADRTQRAAIARMAPSARPRLFTLRQAAAIATHVAAALQDGTLPPEAPAVPVDPQGRLRWLIAELDAGRGLLAGAAEGSEDIVDLHGPQPHEETLDEVTAAVAELTQALAVVLAPR